jgi:hypothetical protein
MPLVVHIPDEQVQRLDALLDAGIEQAPVGGGEHARDQVEGQDAVDGVALAIDREGDAQHEQLALGVFRAGGQVRQLHLLEPVPEGGEIAIAVLGLAEQLAEKRAWIVSVERRSHIWIPQDSYVRHSGPRLLETIA